MLESVNRRAVLAALQCGARFAHQLARGFQFALFLDGDAGLLQFRGALGPLAGARECEAKLVTRGPEFGIELYRFPELSDGVRQ